MESFSKMATPNFLSLPWLRLYELDTRRALNVMMNVAPTSILCFFSYTGGDDIEVAFKPEDCSQIAEIFENAVQPEAGSVQSQRNPGMLTHRFKNIDGGEEAAFLLEPKGESVEVTVERSDEGVLQFRISFEDVRKLAETLRIACSRAHDSASDQG
jgi:hypothetical protein